ncbi:jg6515 [Pararge aegeria aegeria]|uniref:Jg6515 protein n=1 Tax=Pararge aegeria aegeria TaxID=348720 RepID=A0A8S4QMR1_9NEOP|nr:jg6515 [Pararge aegeria aegeria]
MLMEYQPHKDATADGVSLSCGRTGKQEQDCEVPEHTHRSISGEKHINRHCIGAGLFSFACVIDLSPIILLARRSTESKSSSWYLAEPPYR